MYIEIRNISNKSVDRYSPAWNDLELVELKSEDSPTVLDQGADAQRARRRPDGKGHEVFKKDGDRTIKLTRRMKLRRFSANMSDDDGGYEVEPGIHGRLQVPNFDLSIIGPAYNSLTVEPAHQIG